MNPQTEKVTVSGGETDLLFLRKVEAELQLCGRLEFFLFYFY
jgi:hypothetical protein